MTAFRPPVRRVRAVPRACGARRVALGLWLLAGAILLPGPAAAEPSLIGSWSGRYTCSQGLTGLTLTIKAVEATRVRALLHFYQVPENPGVPTGCYEAEGIWDPATGQLVLDGTVWVLRPRGYIMTLFQGHVDGARFTGRVVARNCTSFALTRQGPPQDTPAACRVDPLISSHRGQETWPGNSP